MRIAWYNVGASGNGGSQNGCPLTPRQKELLQYAADGLPVKQIAFDLGLKESYVKMAYGRTYKALRDNGFKKIHGATAAVALALRRDWIE